MSGRIQNTYLSVLSVISRLGALFLGNLMGAAFGFAVLILLTRMLTPQEYGKLALVLTLLDMVQVVIEGAVFAGVMQVAANHLKDAPQNSNMALKLGFISRLGMSIFACILIWVFAPMLAKKVYQDPESTWIIRTAITGIIGLVLFSNALGVSLLKQQYYKVAMLTVSKNGLRFLLLAALAMGNLMTLNNAILAIIVATILCALYSKVMVPLDFLRSPGVDKKIFREIYDINKWTTVGSIGMLASRLDVYLLAWMSGAEETAYYAASLQLCTIVVLFSQAVANYIFPQMALFKKRSMMRRHFKKNMRLILLLMPACAVALLLTPILLPLILGNEYQLATATFSWLIASAFLTMAFNPLGLLLFPLGKVKIIAIFAILQLVMRVILNIWVIPRYGAQGAAAVDFFIKLVFNSIILAMIVHFLWRKPMRATPRSLQSGSERSLCIP